MSSSPKKKFKKPKAGDIIRIPIGSGRFVFGQLLSDGFEFVVCVYGPELSAKNGSPQDEGFPDRFFPILCAMTTDAPLYFGEWSVVCNAAIPEGIPMPVYRLSKHGQGEFIVRYDEKVIRKVRAGDEEIFPLRSNYGHGTIVRVAREFIDGNIISANDRDILVTEIEKCISAIP